MEFNKIYIPYVGRDKYEDNRKTIINNSNGSSGGGVAGGGVGTTEYMTAFETGSGDAAGHYTISGLTALSTLSNGVSILVKFNKASSDSVIPNTIDVGFGAEGDSGETFQKPLYISSGSLVTNEIVAGDELWLTYRDYLSGWTIDASNERYARDLFDKVNNNGKIYAFSQYHIASSGDVLSYGADDIVPSGFSVIDNLNSNSGTDALSARQGKLLNDRVVYLETSAITQIKTINGYSLIGEGNLAIEGGSGSAGTFAVGSGLTFDAENQEYRVSDAIFQAIDSKYDKTGGYVSGSVIASGDVVAYGAESVVPVGLSVIDNLNSNSGTDALSARQGKLLNQSKQDSLVSGENIKTINGQSILGSGNITIEGGSGGSGGTTYYAGSGISIDNAVISVSSGLFATLDTKYDKTGGYVSGSVIASGDVMCYGAESVVPTGLTVIQDLNHSSDDLTQVLGARQGYLLNQSKQETLISGTNIKTINGISLLGSGNISIEGGSGGGGGGGNTYYAGTNINITDYVISVTGSVASAQYASDAGTLNGYSSSSFARTSGYYSQMSVGSADHVDYATRLGDTSDWWTYTSLSNALAGKMGTGDTASDSNKLGGTPASGYLKTGDTAYNSDRLGGTAASGYLKTGDTAYDSTRWGGYKIVVGSIGSASNTIYFGY